MLAPEIAALARAVADRYAGTLADVLRLAVPPRHARIESEPPPTAPTRVEGKGTYVHIGGTYGAPIEAWAGHPSAPAFLDALARGDAPRAVWTAPPGVDPAAAIARRRGGDGRRRPGSPRRRPRRARRRAVRRRDDFRRSRAEMCVVLTADLGPAERYRRWLAVRRGTARVVVGTRAAMFAPVRDLGLAVVWDDGDDLHAEPRAPYPHVREVLALRAHLEQSGLARRRPRTHRRGRAAARRPGGPSRSTPTVPRYVPRAPTVRTIGGDTDLARDPAARSARLPSVAWEAARAGLADGPVLVQVPRRGYAPSLACARCREPARCLHCAGPLASGAADRASCTWCGRPATTGRARTAAARSFRAQVVGARRTAEELARAFPGATVRTSGRDGVLASVPDEPALVVATPGAEPLVDGGAYAAALLLDGDRLVARPDLRAGEEALRRWLNAAALVRRAGAGGVVVVVADPGLAAVQALVRWDPAGAADRELAERAALHLPPAARVAVLTGPPEAVADFVPLLTLPPGAEVLGPTVVEADTRAKPSEPSADTVRTLVRVPVAEGAALSDALRAASGIRSARKAADHVQVMVDPVALG